MNGIDIPDTIFNITKYVNDTTRVIELLEQLLRSTIKNTQIKEIDKDKRCNYHLQQEQQEQEECYCPKCSNCENKTDLYCCCCEYDIGIFCDNHLCKSCWLKGILYDQLVIKDLTEISIKLCHVCGSHCILKETL